MAHLFLKAVLVRWNIGVKSDIGEWFQEPETSSIALLDIVTQLSMPTIRVQQIGKQKPERIFFDALVTRMFTSIDLLLALIPNSSFTQLHFISV